MEISERKVGGVTVVDISGKLVASDQLGRLKDKVPSLVFQGEKQIVLNLANVSYMDSSGLGEMVACHGSATRAGGEIKLANTGKKIKDLLIMTRLYTVFDAHDTEAEAIKSFASGAA
jgi:anti-sigma B factor antagonist